MILYVGLALYLFYVYSHLIQICIYIFRTVYHIKIVCRALYFIQYTHEFSLVVVTLRPFYR